MKEIKNFPNGFACWQETHYEIVSLVERELSKDNPSGVIGHIYERQGIGGMYELAEDWTDEFEQNNQGREWDGDFPDEICEFVKRKNNEKK
jgi:hypothetical protein